MKSAMITLHYQIVASLHIALYFVTVMQILFNTINLPVGQKMAQNKLAYYYYDQLLVNIL